MDSKASPLHIQYSEDGSQSPQHQQPLQLSVATLISLYLITGAISPALIDFLRISGAMSDYPPTLLPMLSNTLGMALVGQLKQTQLKIRTISFSPKKNIKSLSCCSPFAGSSRSRSNDKTSHHQLVSDEADDKQSPAVVAGSSVSPIGKRRVINEIENSEFALNASKDDDYQSSNIAKEVTGNGYDRESGSRNLDVPVDKSSLQDDRVSLTITKATTLDFVSNVMVTAGLLWTGSGTFSVIASSGVAWTAIICHFLGQKLSLSQQSGILVVTLGLILNGLGNTKLFASMSATTLSESDADNLLSQSSSDQVITDTFTPHTFFLGCILVLVGTILHSAMFVFCEAQLKFHTVDRFQLCGSMGTNEFFALMLWNILLSFAWGGPYNLYIRPIEEHATTPEFNLFLMTTLVVCNATHAYSFFSLLDKMGSISMGILKGVLSITVFAIASLLYCGIESTQCVTFIKAASILMVVGGSILYSLSSTSSSVMNFSPRASKRAQIV